MPKGEFKQFKFKARDGSEYVIGDKGRHLDLTPERVEASIREQARLAESSPYISVSPQMAQVLHARRVAVDWLEGLKQTELELHQRHTKAERKDLQRLFNHYSKLLAEALATMGEFEQALTVLPKNEVALRKEFQAMHRAVWLDDDARCGEKCAKAIEMNPNLVTAERVHKYVFSKKHGKILPAIACGHCGAFNVRPPDGQLLARMTARQRADDLIKDKSPNDAVATLRANKLTAEHVLKV
jgi:hypothetical protein